MTRDELIELGIRVYKDNPTLSGGSPGLAWLKAPLERVLDAWEPILREDEQENVAAGLWTWVGPMTSWIAGMNTRASAKEQHDER